MSKQNSMELSEADERAAFEKVVKGGFLLERKKDGTYLFRDTDLVWNSWLARAAVEAAGDAKRAWNSQADSFNQWEELGGDEKSELISTPLYKSPAANAGGLPPERRKCTGCDATTNADNPVEQCDSCSNRPAADNEVHLVDAVDAAMVEMANISPPLRRSECARLIRAALGSAEQHSDADAMHLLRQKSECCDEWQRKTEWVQENISSFPLSALGKHRADVMREEIERLRADVAYFDAQNGGAA